MLIIASKSMGIVTAGLLLFAYALRYSNIIKVRKK